MPVDILTPVVSAVLGVLGTLFIQRLSEAELRYEIQYPYPTEENLIYPIRVFNPKKKTLNNIAVLFEFYGPIQNVTAKTNLADPIEATPENMTMRSKINRLNQGNYVLYVVKVLDVDDKPIKNISVNSDEVKGKEFNFKKMSELYELGTLIMGILFGIAIGMVITIISLLYQFSGIR